MAQTPLKLGSVGALTALALTLLATPASAAPPTNDDFGAGEVVPSLPHTTTSDTTEATRAEDDPACIHGLAPTVWYSYTSSFDGWLDLDLNGSTFDTTLGVYTGERGGLTEVACNDDDPRYGLASAVKVPVTAGTTYHIQVSGLGSAAGPVRLNLQEGAPPPPPPPPPARLTSMSVAVTGATVNRAGLVTMSGTVVCDQPGYTQLWLTASQTSRRFTATGSGFTWGECGTTPTPFTVTMTSGTGVSFVAGKTTSTYTAYAHGSWPVSEGFAEANGTGEMRLRAVR